MNNDSTDEELMIAYAAGDSVAFETLYSRHKGPVYRYMLRLSRNEAIAEELFQEVWIKLIKARQSYVVTAKFTTWLYKLAHNHFIDHYRKQNVRVVLEQANELDDIYAQDSEESVPEKQLQMEQSLKKVTEILETLPNEQREVFLLREEAGMSLPEIAETVGINLEAAKSRLRYAVSKLRKGLGEE